MPSGVTWSPSFPSCCCSPAEASPVAREAAGGRTHASFFSEVHAAAEAAEEVKLQGQEAVELVDHTLEAADAAEATEETR